MSGIGTPIDLICCYIYIYISYSFSLFHLYCMYVCLYKCIFLVLSRSFPHSLSLSFLFFSFLFVTKLCIVWIFLFVINASLLSCLYCHWCCSILDGSVWGVFHHRADVRCARRFLQWPIARKYSWWFRRLFDNHTQRHAGLCAHYHCGHSGNFRRCELSLCLCECRACY